MNKFVKKSHKGFTIIQLVIGMLIFAILTGIAFYGVSVYTKQANETRVDSDLGTFEVAIKDYMLNNANACSDGTLNVYSLNSYLTDENKVVGASGAALAETNKTNVLGRSVLKDPWGHEYYIRIDNNEDRTDTGADPAAATPTKGVMSKDNAYIYVYTAGKDGRASDAADQKGAAPVKHAKETGEAATGSVVSPSAATDATEADQKKDDSVLVVSYHDGEVYSHVYQPSDLHDDKVTCDNGNYTGAFGGKEIPFIVK